MSNRDKKDKNLENLMEIESEKHQENSTEEESEYDRYAPVPCLNFGYH